MKKAKFWLIAAAIMGLMGVINSGASTAAAARPPIQPPPPLLPLGNPTGTSGPAPSSSASAATTGANKAANTYVYPVYPGGHNIVQMFSPVSVIGVKSYNNGTQYPGRFFAHSFYFTGVNQNAGQGYIGLETKLQTCGGVDQGFGVIFSVFGATGASINGGVSNQVCTGVENGLSYYSLHWPFTWNAYHTYTMAVSRADSTHYDGWMYDGPTAYYLGRITTPSWGYFLNQSVQWTEDYPYYKTYNGCAYIDTSIVDFYRPWMNDGVNSYYSALPANTYIQDDGGVSFCTQSSSISGDLGGGRRREQVGTF